MKKQLLKSALIAVASVGLFAGSAMALQIEFYDGTNYLKVMDNDSNDKKTAAGIVKYYTDEVNFGAWSIDDATATSEPVAHGDSLLLNFASVDASSTRLGYLSITVTDTFDPGNYTGFYTNINSTRNSILDTDYYVRIIDSLGTSYDLDIENIANGNYDITKYINTNTGNFSSGVWTIVMKTVLNGEGRTSFDATTSPVPEPAAMLLFGTGIAGLAGIGRRRKN